MEFTDYVSPNLALADGSLDVNCFQHKPYLESFSKARGLSLTPVVKQIDSEKPFVRDVATAYNSAKFKAYPPSGLPATNCCMHSRPGRFNNPHQQLLGAAP